MLLVDTSVWIDIFRDASGAKAGSLLELLAGEEVVLGRFHQLEMLQGCRDEQEWNLLKSYLDGQRYLELEPPAWEEAARIFFDLRRTGRTVRSPIDCCIAQLALDHDVTLLHRDRDYEVIAELRPLRQAWVEW